MRIAIVGSRTYPDFKKVVQYVRQLPQDTVIISGGAAGVDTWAEETARYRGLEVRIFPAEWSKYGKTAGFRRNTTIVEKAEKLVAFWDGISRGTFDSIQKAIALEIPVEIHEITHAEQKEKT